jgi:diaminohydroxyphosphoribosylaminopyrimidine deaminase/5-amino-6-(5-phosphoribosylamino)uracil reductase
MNLNQRIEQWLTETRNRFDASNIAGSRPFVTLCFAQSLDGSLTTKPGETLRLSSAESTRLTHQLRSLHDGILVGIGTVLADDPQLTVREWPGNSPQPIVLDSQLRMPASAKLCQSQARRCWVLTAQQAQPSQDCELLQVAANGTGQVDIGAALHLLRQRDIRHLMVEGGASVITAFLQAGFVDAVVITIAPRVIGGYRAVGELGFCSTQYLPTLQPVYSDRIGDDLIVWGALQFSGAAA